MMKISVIMPVWNTGSNACALAKNLLGQYEGLEIIAVDDGSTDDSLAQLKKMARQEKRLKVISQKNGGAASARNAGINISQGEYLMFVDSDDAVADSYITKMLSALDGKKSAMLAVCGVEYNWLKTGRKKAVYTTALRRRRNREKIGDYVLYLLCRDGRMYSSVNKIYRAEIIRKNHLKFEEGREFAEDSIFVLDYIAACAKDKKYSSGDIIFVNEALYIYNYGTETSTVGRTALDWANWEKQYQDSVNFVKNSSGIGLRTIVLMGLLALRWRISHGRAVRRAKHTAQKKVPRGQKQPQRAGKFILVGLVVTAFDFLISTLFTRVIFHDNKMQAVATMIATALATVLAYVMHSHITWKERKPAKYGVLLFFIWNALLALMIRPGITWLLGKLTGLYEFGFGVSSALGLPFSYDTVEYLGIYALLTIITLTINFFFYDRLVFGKKK